MGPNLGVVSIANFANGSFIAIWLADCLTLTLPLHLRYECFFNVMLRFDAEMATLYARQTVRGGICPQFPQGISQQLR